MSKLGELIAEFCPDGVEYRKLESIGKFTRGKRFVRSDVVDNGISAIHYGDIYTSYGIWADTAHININETLAGKMRFAKKNDVIVVGAGENDMDIGIAVAWLGEEKVAIHDACYIFEHSMDSKYISYYMRSSMYHLQIKKYVSTGKICAISAKGIGQALIPVPPLEVQREIVRILDNFTELTEKIIMELTEEFSARKKQYEYYRSRLFEFKNEQVKWKILGDVYNFQYGEGNTIPNTGGCYPVYGSNGIVGKHNKYNSEDAPVIGHIGAYAGIVNWGNGKHFVTYNGVICKIKENLNPKFGYYFLLLQDFRSKARSGSQPFISYDILKKVEIPIPNITTQERIVAILDQLDTLYDGLRNGLQSEIKARQKQYEYYRDKLLTFKECEK